MQEAEGFEIPIHRSLTEQILMGGVPRAVAIINGTVAAAFGIGLQSLYVLPVSLVIHLAAVLMTKRDPQFFDCFKRHIKHKRFYST